MEAMTDRDKKAWAVCCGLCGRLDSDGNCKHRDVEVEDYHPHRPTCESYNCPVLPDLIALLDMLKGEDDE